MNEYTSPPRQDEAHPRPDDARSPSAPDAPAPRSPSEPVSRDADSSGEDKGETQARARSRRKFGFFIALLLALGIGWGFLHGRDTRLEAEGAKRQYRDATPEVHVAEVKPAGATVDITLPGAMLAYQAADIYARANGYVEKRFVDIGDHVKTGDVLAILTAPELDHQIAQAEAARAQAQATVRQTDANQKLAQVTNARSAVLVRQGWVTPQQGDNDRLSLAAQQAALGAAQSNDVAQENAIRVLRQERDYLTVTAPFDGVVTMRNIDAGALVQTGATLMFNMQQTDTIRVQSYVPQDQAYGVAPGVDVIVRVPELPGRTFPGKITRISVALLQGTRTLLAEADVPNPDGALKAGAYCRMELHIPRKSPALIVPGEAVIFNRNGQQVAVVKDGKAELRKINVTRDFGTAVETDTGVEAGDQVVVNPMVDLSDGQKVKIVEAKPEKK